MTTDWGRTASTTAGHAGCLFEKSRIGFLLSMMVTEADQVGRRKSVAGDIAEEVEIYSTGSDVCLQVGTDEGDAQVRLSIPKGMAIELAHEILRCVGD
jgi:hypothetical protein